MSITNNFKLFDKKGNDLNLKRNPQYDLTIKDDTGVSALLEPIVDITGTIIEIRILSPGISYTNPEIEIIDKKLGTLYSLQGEGLIKLNSSGGFESITLDVNPIGFTFPSVKLTGTIFFDENAANLIENSHIFILEEFRDSYGGVKYGTPQVENISPSATIRASFQKGPSIYDEAAIFLFSMDFTDPITPTFNKETTIDYEVDAANGNFLKGYRINDTGNSDSTQIDVGFSATEEGVYERNLILSIASGSQTFPFAEILMRGESLMEDERLKLMLENFGIVIGEQEELIFRDSDINEDLPNYALLNLKRKEMLLEYKNIFPYIGSYKALVNIINFFGYYDLSLREYWINFRENSATYGQQRQVEIPLQLSQRGKSIPTELLLPTSTFTKTDYFGLFFDINRVTGEVDEWGTPITEDSFLFTIEEMLIKLFSLKKYLKDKFLPLNARIIDITGEGFYFTRYALKTWQDKTPRLDVLWKVSPDFYTLPEDKFITDITNYKNTDPPRTPYGSPNPISIEYRNYVGNYMETDEYPDQSTTAIGAPVDLISTTFDIVWNEMDMSWNQLVPSESLETLEWLESITPPGTPGMTYSDLAGTIEKNSWDTVGFGEFIELEWSIIHNNPNLYSYRAQGPILDMKVHQVALPYAGTHYVTLTAIDLNNFRVKKTSPIEISLPNADFISIARFYDYVETWDTADLDWNEVSSNWTKASVIHDNTWNEMNLKWSALDMSTYLYQDDPITKLREKNILDIWEASHSEGNIIEIRKDQNEITIDRQKRAPELVIGDFLFFRFGKSTIRKEITNIEYKSYYTEIYFDSLPIGISEEWKVYRTIVSNIIVQGNQIYDETNNPNGLQVGDKVMMENVSEREEVVIDDVIFSADLDEPEEGFWPVGIILNTPIVKKSGEFGIIYQKENDTLSVLEDADNIRTTVTDLPITFGMYSSYFLQLSGRDFADSLVAGFSEIEITGISLVTGETKTLRALVKNFWKSVTNDLTIVDFFDISKDSREFLTVPGSVSVESNWRSNIFGTKLNFGENDTSDLLYLNFNDYPFDTNFVVETTPGLALNGIWYYEKNPKDTIESFEIQNIGRMGGNTLIDLDDTGNNLYSCNTTFQLTHQKFDEKYAIDHYGSKNYLWDKMKENDWDEMEHLVWDFLEFHEETLCGWRINSVGNGGTIELGGCEIFTFSTIPILGTGTPVATEEDQWNAAVEELNNSTSEGISKFQYNLYENGTPGTWYIWASAKLPGSENLTYITFSGNVTGEYEFDPTASHTYPIGNFKDWYDPNVYGINNAPGSWNVIPNVYYYQGTNVEGDPGWYPWYPVNSLEVNHLPEMYRFAENSEASYKLQYYNAIISSTSWDDTLISQQSVSLKPPQTVFFSDDNCKIVAKKKRTWKIYDENGKTLIETNKDFLIWKFTTVGTYDVELILEDKNGNTENVLKKGFVEIK